MSLHISLNNARVRKNDPNRVRNDLSSVEDFLEIIAEALVEISEKLSDPH